MTPKAEETAEMETVDCPFCDGLGHNPHVGKEVIGSMCIHCNGSGKVPRAVAYDEPPSEPFEEPECPTCKGIGRTFWTMHSGGKNEVCPTCSGTGKVDPPLRF